MTINRYEPHLLSEELELTLGELCRACHLPAEHILALVDEGVIEPQTPHPEPARWRFQAVCVKRVHRASRLERDLGINAAGVALVIELLDEIDRLHARLQRQELGRD